MQEPKGLIDVSLPGSTLWLIPKPDLSLSADEVFKNLFEEIPWEVKSRVMWGREVREPRMMSWHGDPGCNYSFSGHCNEAQAWTPCLSQLRDDMDRLLAIRFNSALCNLYRDGKDSIGAHSDDEPELGSKPIIASLNLGGERIIKFRSKDPRFSEHKTDLQLTHGSLLIMAGDTQRNYTHQIDKVKKSDPRINVTFRTIYSQKTR